MIGWRITTFYGLLSLSKVGEVGTSCTSSTSSIGECSRCTDLCSGCSSFQPPNCYECWVLVDRKVTTANSGVTDMTTADSSETPVRLEGRYGAVVVCWFLGLGSLVAWNSMLTIGDYYYALFPRYIADIGKAWPVLIVCRGIVPLFLLVIWLLMIRHFTAAMAWITVFIFNILMISVSMLYYLKATAVMVTALEGHVEAFRLLVYVGADVKLSNKSGETAIGLSKLCPNCDLFKKVMLEFALEKGNHNGGEFHADDMNNPFSALERSSSSSNSNELKDELRPDCIFPVPDHGLEHGYL